jgi:hypothetical protein
MLARNAETGTLPYILVFRQLTVASTVSSSIEEMDLPLILGIKAAYIGLAFSRFDHDSDAVERLVPGVEDVSRHDAA